MFTINQNLIDDFADKINEKEKKSNKVTSLSSESTDTEYPSAKAVYDNISSATTAINNRITNLNEGTINIVGTPYNQLGGATATSLATLLHNIDNNFGDILFCAYNVSGTADAFTISGTGGFGNLTSNHPFILLAYNNVADSNARATLTINNTMNPVTIVNNRMGGSASCAWKKGEWGIFFIYNGSAQLLGSFSDTEYYQGMEFVTSTNTQNTDTSLTGVTHKLNNLKDGTIFFYQLPNLRFTSESTTFVLTLRNNISMSGTLKENNVNQSLNQLSPNDILILQYSTNPAAYNIIGKIKANTFTEKKDTALQLLCNAIFPYRIFTVHTVKKEDRRTTYLLTYDGVPYAANEILYVYVPAYEVTTDKKPILSWENVNMPGGSGMYIYPINSGTALYENDLNGYYLKIQYRNYRWELLEKTNNIVEATTEHAGLLSVSDKTKLNNLHTVATSGSYNDLSNKPTIPSKTSDLTNDSGFLTSHQSLDSKTVTVEEQSQAETGFTKTYIIKQGGVQVGNKINIPKDFLVKSASVKTVSTANNPVQGYVTGDKYLDFVVNSKDNTATDEHLYVLVSELVDTEIDWANVQNKPTFFDGNYNSLTNKPTIPSKTSDLTNDSGFLTSHQSLSGYLQTSDVKDNLTSTDTNKPLSAKQGKELKTLVDNKIDKGNIQGGVNLLGQWQGEKKSDGNCSMPTRTYSVFHENPIDVIDNQSISDTSDYSGMKYMIKASVFQPTDVFTFSFWAKGDANNTNNTIRAYFSNGMNVRRLYSNSDVDYGESESSSNDGNTLFNLTDEWQLFTVTYQIKEGGTNQSSKYPSIRVYGGCKCSVSSAKLERGFNATDYSPCDEIPINLNYNIDYNDYKNDGNYFVWGSQQTGNTNKPPSDTQGGLLTVKSIPNGCIQILYNYFLASPQVYYRIYHASQGWRNWQTLSVDGHTHNSTDIKSVKIPSGDDLNDYIATGFYYNPSNTEAQNITNIPESGKAFFLLVEDWGTYNYTKQTITHYGTGKTYTRIRNSGNWGAWKKLINVDDASSSKGLADDPYNGLVGTSTKYAREDHAHGKLYHWSTGGVSTATYVDLLEFTMTTSWQDIPISLVLGKRARDRPYYVNIRFSNTNITSSTYTVDSFKVWGGDETALLLYLRKVEDNKYRLCAYKAANDVYYINDIVNFNTGITITKIASADGNYGTTAPTGSAPNLYSLTKVDDLPKGIIQGGKNVISTLPVTYNNSGVLITTDGETFHNETVYKSLLSEVSDTSKYSDIGFVIPYENFTYGDVFTLSFWAKGTSGKEIKTYFYGDSGYINNKRIRSNSPIDNTEGSYNDGLTKFILTNEWQHFYVTYKLNTTGTATANKKIAIRTFGGTDCSVACVQLERGEIATDYERPPLTQFSGLVSTACYVNLLQFEMTESYQDNPINIEISYKGRERPTQLQIRFSNTNLSASTNNVYTVSIFKSTQDQFTYYLRKVADNKYMLIGYKGVNAWFNIHKIWNSNTGVKISIANTSYGTSAPTGSAPNLYVSSYAGVCDTELTWNGSYTSNNVSPLTMAMGDDFSANRLAYFPYSQMSVEYSTDGGSTWSTYSSIGNENKQRLTTNCRTNTLAYLGNNSSTDRTKNQLRITFDCGDIGSDSVLYMIARKLAMYTGTNNSTGFTCQVQTQTYAQYNTNVNTFSNVGGAMTLGGNQGWNTRPLNITLGGYASQTSSTSTRIKALRLLFVQTGGTGNGNVSKIRLYGETAYVTPSSLARDGHICYTDVNQNAVFPSKIIKDGGTSSQFLMANGDVQNKVTSWSNTPSDSNIASEKLVKDSLDQLGVIDLTSYTNNVSDYDANGISLSVTENNELYVTNGGDYKPYHTKTFTNNDTYTIQFDIKQSSGAYAGKRFCILIGDPSNVLEIIFRDYFTYVYLDGDIIGQISAIEISDYKTIRIHRNLNDWIFDYNNGEKTITFRTSNDIPNKISYYGLGADEELYVKNVKLYANSIANNVNNIVDMIYPIGSIYMSVNSTSPQILFGGTWEQIKDKFLLASGTSYSNGATGGSATVTLSENEIPTHNHNSKTLTGTTRIQQYNGSASSTTGIISQSNNNYNIKNPTGSGTNFGSTTLTVNATHTHDNIGGGQAHENMPPYIVVNVWKRTA